MNRIPVAVVGCGIFGQVHAEAYARFEHSDLKLVCDLNEERAKATAEKFNCDYTTNVEDVAGDPDILAVSLVTPDFTHRKPGVTLLRAGKHVLIEKPLATSSDDAVALIQAARDTGVIAGIDYHNRYHPAFVSLKKKLEEGKIGDPRMIFARLSDRLEVATEWFAWSSQTGPEWFLGSHLVDLACWLMDAQPERVYADGRRGVLEEKGIDCFDCFQMHLSFPKGMATLETSWILPNTWPSVADFSVTLQTTTSRMDVIGTPHGMIAADPKAYSWPFLHGMTAIGEDTFGYFHLPIHDFVRSVIRGGPAPAPLDEGLATVQIIEALLESVKQRQAVEMAYQA